MEINNINILSMDKLSLDSKLNFLIKSKTSNEIQLKPILNSVEKGNGFETINSKDTHLIRILNEYSVEEDNISIEFLNNLMEYNVPVNEKNVISGMKILDKLEQLININEDTHTIVSLEEGTEFNKVDIRNLLVVSKNRDDGNKNQSKNFLNIEDLKFKINQSTEEMTDFKTLDSNLIKTVALFIKHDIKASINNIRYFLELNKASDSFLKDLKFLQKDLKYEKFTISDKKAMINNGSFKNIIEESYIKYKIVLEKTMEYIKENPSIIYKTISKKIKELQDKLDFLEEINHELSFIYIPLILNNNYDNAITLLKDRKKKNNPNNKINVFINLNTNNLGNIKIFCDIISDIINIKFIGLKNEDVNLFKNREEKLKIAILNTGYILGNIEYMMEEEKNILDFLIVNKDPVYYLDVEV